MKIVEQVSVGKVNQVVFQPALCSLIEQTLMNLRFTETGIFPPEKPDDIAGIPTTVFYPFAKKVCPSGDFKSGVMKGVARDNVLNFFRESRRNSFVGIDPEHPGLI